MIDWFIEKENNKSRKKINLKIRKEKYNKEQKIVPNSENSTARGGGILIGIFQFYNLGIATLIHDGTTTRGGGLIKIIKIRELFQRLDRVIVATLDSGTPECNEAITSLKALMA